VGASVPAGRESGPWMRLGRAFSTLLGPEGTTWAGPGGVGVLGVVLPGGGLPWGVVVVSARHDLVLIPFE
jgi:hypothetical protein